MPARIASASVTPFKPAGQEQTMEPTAIGLSLFLALDVLGSVALAAWLGVHTGGASDWDR